MIICHSRRFIFFSNPKTGSETMRALLAPFAEEPVVAYRARTRERPFYPHMSPVEAEWTFDALGLAFRSYRRITCVRDPFTRLVSLYRMIADVDGLWRLRRRAGLGQPDFETWLRSTRPSGRGGGGRAHQRWRRYGAWSAQHWCGDRISDTLRLETLAHDLPPLLDSLDIVPPTAALPQHNARDPVDISQWYSPSTSALVARRYAWDIAHFGYARPNLQGAA